MKKMKTNKPVWLWGYHIFSILTSLMWVGLWWRFPYLAYDYRYLIQGVVVLFMLCHSSWKLYR